MGASKTKGPKDCVQQQEEDAFTGKEKEMVRLKQGESA